MTVLSFDVTYLNTVMQCPNKMYIYTCTDKDCACFFLLNNQDYTWTSVLVPNPSRPGSPRLIIKREPAPEPLIGSSMVFTSMCHSDTPRVTPSSSPARVLSASSPSSPKKQHLSVQQWTYELLDDQSKVILKRQLKSPSSFPTSFPCVSSQNASFSPISSSSSSASSPCSSPQNPGLFPCSSPSSPVNQGPSAPGVEHWTCQMIQDQLKVILKRQLKSPTSFPCISSLSANFSPVSSPSSSASSPCSSPHHPDLSTYSSPSYLRKELPFPSGVKKRTHEVLDDQPQLTQKRQRTPSSPTSFPCISSLSAYFSPISSSSLPDSSPSSSPQNPGLFPCSSPSSPVNQAPSAPGADYWTQIIQDQLKVILKRQQRAISPSGSAAHFPSASSLCSSSRSRQLSQCISPRSPSCQPPSAARAQKRTNEVLEHLPQIIRKRQRTTSSPSSADTVSQPAAVRPSPRSGGRARSVMVGQPKWVRNIRTILNMRKGLCHRRGRWSRATGRPSVRSVH